MSIAHGEIPYKFEVFYYFYNNRQQSSLAEKMQEGFVSIDICDISTLVGYLIPNPIHIYINMCVCVCEREREREIFSE